MSRYELWITLFAGLFAGVSFGLVLAIRMGVIS